jgi:hypothetical protein
LWRLFFRGAFPFDRLRGRVLSAAAGSNGRPRDGGDEGLKGFEQELRKRDSGKTDTDEKWSGYVYPKSLDKQEVPKLLVPRLVSRLGCFVDDRGRFYCDNVDVGGVVPQRVGDIWLLAGIINAPVTNVIFGWLTKPFRGEYKSANKQFIAPLPIPKGDRISRASLSALAKGMQERRTAQVDKRAALEERLQTTDRANWPLEKLLADVRSIEAVTAAVPNSVAPSDRKAWVDAEREADEETAYARIDAMIRLDSEFAVTLADGKLALAIDEQEAARVFVSDAEAALVEAQWRCIAIDTQPTGKGDAKRLVQRLRRVATRAEPAVAGQIVAIGNELSALDAVIRDDEAQLHEMTCALFNLSPAERALVEGKRG